MNHPRSIKRHSRSHPTIEGAGVRLHRAFGYHDLPAFDPFLMFDDFRGDRPDDYLAGFPWHPHRGIETMTYMLEGTVEHGDSMGHAGSVDAGGIQWMTAGSGIIHQEMPKPVNGRMGGFQLWVNLPRAHKMMDPRYQEISADAIPTVTMTGGVGITVISGTIGGITGPVRDIVAEPEYLDVTMQPGAQFTHPVPSGFTAAVYVFEGGGVFDPNGKQELMNRDIALYGTDGDCISVSA